MQLKIGKLCVWLQVKDLVKLFVSTHRTACNPIVPHFSRQVGKKQCRKETTNKNSDSDSDEDDLDRFTSLRNKKKRDSLRGRNVFVIGDSVMRLHSALRIRKQLGGVLQVCVQGFSIHHGTR